MHNPIITNGIWAEFAEDCWISAGSDRYGPVCTTTGPTVTSIAKARINHAAAPTSCYGSDAAIDAPHLSCLQLRPFARFNNRWRSPLPRSLMLFVEFLLRRRCCEMQLSRRASF